MTMQDHSICKINLGAVAIMNLIHVRQDLIDQESLPAASFQPYAAMRVKSGLPQFSADGSDDIQVSTLIEFFHLAEDLIDAGHMTKERADSVNQVFENMTGHDRLVDLRF